LDLTLNGRTELGRKTIAHWQQAAHVNAEYQSLKNMRFIIYWECAQL
jgi:hypothetical protein